MNMIPVESNAVSHIGHDGHSLHITFKNGGTYRYANVPAHIHEDLMKSDSKGSFIHKHIAKKYQGEKVG